MMKLDIRAFALSCCLLWGFGLFFGSWWVIAFDGASIDPTLIVKIYRDYTIAPLGSLIALIWGLADG
ncbi:hypothetical protein [Psychromonas ingrahamii]|uniref:hypothetical protein n=1 Tax=Psychromonas ingrahamii TaxID=357794 RepID=UPI0006742096|nr:hypothetical protein [Psychromonas ingrahamii]